MDSIAKKDVIVIHQNVCQLFHEMFSQIAIFQCFGVSELLNNIYNFACFANHPQ